MTLQSILKKSKTKVLSKKFELKIFKSKVNKRFTSEEEDIIYGILINISSQSFQADQSGFWHSKRHEFDYLKNLTTFILIKDMATDEIIGWTGLRVFKQKKYTVCYLDSSGVIPKYFGAGLITKANGYMIRKAFLSSLFKDFLLFTRTENPVIYRLLYRNLGQDNVFPNIQGKPYPEKYRKGVETIIRYLKQEELLELNSLIIKNAYGYLDELYGDMPTCSDQKINAFFHSQLGANDAFLIFGIFNLKTFFKT